MKNVKLEIEFFVSPLLFLDTEPRQYYFITYWKLKSRYLFRNNMIAKSDFDSIRLATALTTNKYFGQFLRANLAQYFVPVRKGRRPPSLPQLTSSVDYVTMGHS